MPATRSLAEMVFAVHFVERLNFRLLDLADWSEKFSEFSTWQELQPAPRVELHSTVPRFEFRDEPQMPRIIKRGGPIKCLWIQLQEDRFAIGWQRETPAGEPDDYPGYAEMLKHWDTYSSRFFAWHSNKLGGIPQTRFYELTYLNALPVEAGGRSRKLSEVLKTVKPNDPPRRIFAYSANWAEALEGGISDGRVTANFSLVQLPSGEMGYRYEFSGLAVPSSEPQSGAAHVAYNRLHTRIFEMYNASIAADVV